MLTTRLASTGSALLGASRRQLSTLACRGLPTPRRVPNVATLFRARGQPHVLQSGGVRHLSSSAASGFGLLPVLRARATSVLRLAASKVPKGFEGFFRRGASGAFKKLKEKQKDVQKKVRGAQQRGARRLPLTCPPTRFFHLRTLLPPSPLPAVRRRADVQLHQRGWHWRCLQWWCSGANRW